MKKRPKYKILIMKHESNLKQIASKYFLWTISLQNMWLWRSSFFFIAISNFSPFTTPFRIYSAIHSHIWVTEFFYSMFPTTGILSSICSVSIKFSMSSFLYVAQISTLSGVLVVPSFLKIFLLLTYSVQTSKYSS